MGAKRGKQTSSPTVNDGLLEFSLVNQWRAYENFELNLEPGYVVNMMDQDTWRKGGYYGGTGNGSFEMPGKPG